jgi:MFS family permease
MFAWLSDRLKARMWVVLVALGVVILGLILVFVIKSPHGRYAALCIMQIGNFATAPIIVAILANNTPRPGHRAMIFSINSMGNVGGIISAVSFQVVSDTCETTADIRIRSCSYPNTLPATIFRLKSVWVSPALRGPSIWLITLLSRRSTDGDARRWQP